MGRALRLTTTFLCASLLATGCLTARHKKDDLPAVSRHVQIDAAAVYTLASPDLVEILFADVPEWSRTARIGADGAIDLNSLGKIRLEGETTASAARVIADRANVSARRIRVQVVEYASRQLLIHGQIRGEPRLVDYRGPETIVELLRRIGGLTENAKPSEIHIVRAHLGEGIPAEVLAIDLVAILDKSDDRTNVRVQPLDEVYVGELARARIGKAVPALLKPAYDLITKLIPKKAADRSSREIGPKINSDGAAGVSSEAEKLIEQPE